MKLREYKGYDIEVGEFSGAFGITGITGSFGSLHEVIAKIDAIILSESKAGMPIEVVTVNYETMTMGKLTSYNAQERIVWFSRESGSRSKESVTYSSGKPRFFKATPGNLARVKRHAECAEEINKLKTEQRGLESSLTDPLTFPLN